jgi:hypothetical protein
MNIDEGEFAALLERYTVAMAAHQQCLTTLIDAMISDAPTLDIAADERRSHIELTVARKRLIRALARR